MSKATSPGHIPSARWRSDHYTGKHVYTTATLFHMSDTHGLHGLLPDFAKGETWDLLHDRAHRDGAFAEGKAHTH